MKVFVLDSPVNEPDIEPVFLEENEIQGLYPFKDSSRSYWSLKALIELAVYRKEVKTMNKEEFLAIKPEKSPEEHIKWTIETDLYYLCECSHCMIVFLVEEAADSFKNPKHPDKIALTCPVCHTNNLIPKGKNRLKLKLDRIMRPDENNPWYNAIIERSKQGSENINE